MNYYDKNLYYIMYAASGIKLKMRKTHSFYRAQLSLLMKKVVCVSYDLLPRQRGIAVDKGRKWYELLALMSTFRCVMGITKSSGRN